MNKLALKAVAKVAHINIREATTVVRTNPILGDEIHIEEELINLEESIDSYHMAAKTLEQYPDMRNHLIREKRLILKHCVGLVARMIQGKRLPRTYTAQDINYAIRRLVRLVFKDAQRANIRIDDEVMEIMHPLLNIRQRYALWNKPWDYIHLPSLSLGRFLPSWFRA